MASSPLIPAKFTDPETVLVLLRGSPLAVLMVLCMPDCPRPATVDFIAPRSGYGAGTVETALNKLNRWRLVVRTGFKKASAWFLAHGVRQLPLPFVRLLGRDDMRPHPRVIDASASQGFLSGTEPTNGADHHATDPQVGRDPHVVLGHLSTRENLADAERSRTPDEIIIHKNNGLSYAVVDPKDHDPKKHAFQDQDQQQQHGGEIVDYDTAALLRWMGMDEPFPTQYAAADVAHVLACWWYGRVSAFLDDNFRSPQGYVRRRLERDLWPPDPYPLLARTWVGLTDEQKLTLLDALEFSHARNGGLDLPRGFPFIPFREVHLVYRAMDREIVPPDLLPPRVAPVPPETQVTTAAPVATLPGEAAMWWKLTLGELELQMTKATFNTWLKDTRLVDYDGQTHCFVVQVRNDYAKDWLENRLTDTVLRTLRAISDRDCRVRFRVGEIP